MLTLGGTLVLVEQVVLERLFLEMFCTGEHGLVFLSGVSHN